MKIIKLMSLVIVLTCPIFVFSHPGNTASDGCHYCRTNCNYWGEAWDIRHCHFDSGYSDQEVDSTIDDYENSSTYIEDRYNSDESINSDFEVKTETPNNEVLKASQEDGSANSWLIMLIIFGSLIGWGALSNWWGNRK